MDGESGESLKALAPSRRLLRAQLHWCANSTMAQPVDGGPPISIANFGNNFWRFCEVCEGAGKLNRFRSYRPVTAKPQVGAGN
jgi:hypothetical protein